MILLVTIQENEVYFLHVDISAIHSLQLLFKDALRVETLYFVETFYCL